jgi:hypothetical protein
MKARRFHKKFFPLVVLTALAAFAPLALSQPSSAVTEKPVDLKKTAPAPRVRPQVIYHLSKSSGDAAALHSQAKADNNALPIDAGMPTSLQLAHANANAAAAQANTPAPNKQSQTKDAGEPKQRRNVTRTVKARPPAAPRPVRTAPDKTSGAKHSNKH